MLEQSLNISRDIDFELIDMKVLPVEVVLPQDDIDERLRKFIKLPSTHVGLVGKRIADVDSTLLSTETVYTIQAWSHGAKLCACCHTPIPSENLHVLYCPPPIDNEPYHHIHRRPCFDIVLASLVDVWKRPRNILSAHILARSAAATKLKG